MRILMPLSALVWLSGTARRGHFCCFGLKLVKSKGIRLPPDRRRVAVAFRLSVVNSESVGFGSAHDIPTDFPSIALTGYNPRKMATVVSRTAVILKNITPCSGRSYFIAGRKYPTDCGDIIADLPTLEIEFCIFLF